MTDQLICIPGVVYLALVGETVVVLLRGLVLLVELVVVMCLFILPVLSVLVAGFRNKQPRLRARLVQGAVEKGSANAEEAGSAQLQIETGHQLYGIVQDAQQGGHLQH